jgi:hypothetical protein
VCVGDLRLGRFIRAVPFTLGNIVATPFVIPPNRQRVGIGLTILTATSATGSILTATFDNGVVIGGVQIAMPWTITLDRYGELIQHGFTLATTAALMTIAGYELVADERILTVGLDSFNSQYGTKY